MRLFVAIDISEQVRDRVQSVSPAVCQHALDAARVLHFTLKFIGEPEAAPEPMKTGLIGINALSFQVAFRGYGVFPEAARPRICWIGVDAEFALVSLTREVNRKMAEIGLAKDIHPFRPHLTLAHLGSGVPQRNKHGAPRPEAAPNPFEGLQKNWRPCLLRNLVR